MDGKKSIHTTVEPDTYKRIEYWEEKEKMLKNEIIDNAIILMKEFCIKNNISPKDIKKFINENGFGTNLGINLGENFSTKISSITYNVFNGHQLGLIKIDFSEDGTKISHKFSEDQSDIESITKILGKLYPGLYHVFPQGEPPSLFNIDSGSGEALISEKDFISQGNMAAQVTQMPDTPNFNDPKLLEIAESLKKQIDNGAHTREKIIHLLLTQRNSNAMYQGEIRRLLNVRKETAMDSIEKLKEEGLVIKISSKGRRNIVKLNIAEILKLYKTP